jgi:isopentenyldiphosphate isomerase
MKKYNTKTNDPLDELNDIVDKNDKVIGVASRITFLKNKKMIRRSSHIWLKNHDGKYWFQQRSRHKDLQPLHWCCSVSGFVKSGAKTKKAIMEDAKRELKEELGVKADIKLKRIFLHQNKVVGGIMVYLFIGVHDGPFKIDAKELYKIKAFDIEEIWDLYKNKKIKLTTPTVDEIKYFLKND